MALSNDQFAKALVASGLRTAEEVKAFYGALPEADRPKDGDAFAKLLIAQGKLTEFQAEVLLTGKRVPLIMGDYVVLKMIGAGGMGQVFQAEHRRMQRMVAVKVMSAAAMSDESAVRRFQREVKAAARLEHENIVTAFDAGRVHDVNYLVMQYVDGVDLSTLVKTGGPLAMELAVEYISQAAQGLAFAHGEAVIHRDIKPANLLLDKKGVVKILDMGLARFEDSESDGLTGTEQVMGTVDYMSPEQAGDTKHVDARTDIYSLGCTFWYLLTGRRMFDGDTAIQRLMKHRSQERPSLVKARDDVSWPLERVFHKMIAVEKQDRFATMQEVVDALAPYRSGGRSGAAAATSTGPRDSSPHNAELSAFMKTVGPTPTKFDTAKPAVAVKSPPTTAGADATAMYVASDVDTDPQAPSRAGAQSAAAAAGARGSSPAPAAGARKKLLVGGAACLALVAGAIAVAMRSGAEPAAENETPTDAAVGVGNTEPRPAATASQPAATVASAPVGPAEYALDFTPYKTTLPFTIPGWNYAGDAPITIEAWITPRVAAYQLFLGNAKDSAGLNLQFNASAQNDRNQWSWNLVFGGVAGEVKVLKADKVAPLDKRTHVAVTFDRFNMLMFVDGVEQKQLQPGKYVPTKSPFYVGAAPWSDGKPTNSCNALIDELRISRVVRYKKSFTPAARHQSDAETEVLYHFDEGSGDTALDASPYARHAKLERASWVRTPPASEAR